MGLPKTDWSDPEVQEAHAIGNIDDEGKETSEGETQQVAEESGAFAVGARRLVLSPDGHFVCGCNGRMKYLTHVTTDGKNYYCPFCWRAM